MKLRGASIVVAGLAVVPLAFAQVQNRYQVASDPEARGYSSSLAIVFDSPPDYVLDYVGRGGNDAEWKGPRYEATLEPTLGGEASLGWGADVEKKPSTRATVVASLVQGWEIVQEGTEPIEHRVGGRLVGTIPAIWVLTQGSVMAGEARYEAGVAFPLCGRTALIDVFAGAPSGDSAGGTMGYGEYRIMGMAPTAWNREQVLATIRGISLDGSLPAARLTARAAGRRVVGTVADCARHPVAAQPVRLERKNGRRWLRVRSGKSTAKGAYTLRAPSAGTYRVVAGNRRSASIRVR